MKTVLAIESSCDETAVAIAKGTREILCSEIASQVEIHQPYGGVVPELASRNHNLAIRHVLASALESAGLTLPEIDAVAATAGPGLASSLLVGDTTGKAIAIGLGKPFYSINHIEGHLLSPFIGDEKGIRPCVALVVSGGHTLLVDIRDVSDYEVLGSTKDDAAGEAFDKVGKMLELPYPGGPEIDQLSREGNSTTYDFPRSMIDSGDFQFSFSGLKTAVFYQLQKLPEPVPSDLLPDLCASFQEAVVDVLVAKTLAAARTTNRNLVTVSGGVSCNSRLRKKMTEACDSAGFELKIATPHHSTDNAAMIAFAAAAQIESGVAPSALDTDVNPNLAIQ
ncbi:MAG: tRNA (adenosine(37)-N6)-threonylcarbamoyltransferase complex transferase subunit TsaD [Verrucomicrobiales bacterium]|nr:tRNA (adenosine(37)-N6)-threonylcarbamoyltransferase complex transferase subunit TsaD [Verrucomicrobiales bacterium]